jgi:hypothetical protein
MINLNFTISNPWSNRWEILWNKSKFIGKNKAVEFNGYRTNHIVNVDFNFRPAGDHAGARIMLGLFGFDAELHFYDTRHWNYETNTWEVYDKHQ